MEGWHIAIGFILAGLLVRWLAGGSRRSATADQAVVPTADDDTGADEAWTTILGGVEERQRRRLDIDTLSGNGVFRRMLPRLVEATGEAPDAANCIVKNRFGLRLHLPRNNVVVLYVWAGPMAFLWRYWPDTKQQHGLLLPIGPLGLRAQIRITVQDGVVLVQPDVERAPESYLEALRCFDQALLHEIARGLMSLPLFTRAGAVDDFACPVELDAFFAHLASARFITLLDQEQVDAVSQTLDITHGDNEGRPRNWLPGDGYLVEVGDGMAIDSHGRLQTRIGEDVVLRSDGKYAIELGAGIAVDSDGVLSTRVADDVVIHSDGRVTTSLFGFMITLGEEKPKRKGFFDL